MLLQFYQVKKGDDQVSSTYVLHPAWTYPNQDQDAKPQSGSFNILQVPNVYFKGMDVLCTYKIKL